MVDILDVLEHLPHLLAAARPRMATLLGLGRGFRSERRRRPRAVTFGRNVGILVFLLDRRRRRCREGRPARCRSHGKGRPSADAARSCRRPLSNTVLFVLYLLLPCRPSYSVVLAFILDPQLLRLHRLARYRKALVVEVERQFVHQALRRRLGHLLHPGGGLLLVHGRIEEQVMSDAQHLGILANGRLVERPESVDGPVHAPKGPYEVVDLVHDLVSAVVVAEGFGRCGDIPSESAGRRLKHLAPAVSDGLPGQFGAGASRQCGARGRILVLQ
mmetsp:Transcript_5465/g.11878  ORF Transcript_5465/g.11878 Transcript_5465/m.11878 type:complete len:273 (-) Transcript_5465:1011-1829(-)